MSTDRAFLKEIVANPAELTPRLVYADWLDEQGDPRGEFIRVQCELASIDESDGRYPDLSFRERELLAEHRQEWIKPLKPYIRGGTFRCGFIERVRFRLGGFLAEGERVARLTPLRAVAFTAARGNQLLHRLPESPVLSQLAGLEFHSFQQVQLFLRTLCGFPELPRLRRLVISENEGWAKEEFRGLLWSKMCRHLTSLMLPRNNLKSFAFRELSLSTLALKQLDLSGNPDVGKGIRHLANWPALGQIESLHLRGCGIQRKELELLMQSPHLPKFHHLDLSENPFAFGNFHWIVNHPAMEGITALGLRHNQANAADISALTQSPYFMKLRRLDLSLSPECDASLCLLAQWPRLFQLRQLGLTKLYVSQFSQSELEQVFWSPNWNPETVLTLTLSPINADYFHKIQNVRTHAGRLKFQIGDVPMGYLHDPIGEY